jgi:hypothetical protein
MMKASEEGAESHPGTNRRKIRTLWARSSRPQQYKPGTSLLNHYGRHEAENLDPLSLERTKKSGRLHIIQTSL